MTSQNPPDSKSITESRNFLGWERPPRSPSPTFRLLFRTPLTFSRSSKWSYSRSFHFFSSSEVELEADVNAGIVSGGQMMLFHQLDICWELIKPKACWAGPVLSILWKGICLTKGIWGFKPPYKPGSLWAGASGWTFFCVRKMQTTVERFISLWHGCEALIGVHLYKIVWIKGKLRGEEGVFDWQGLMMFSSAYPCALTGKRPDLNICS